MDGPDNEFNCCQCWFPLPATATTLGVNVFQQAKNKLESGQNSKFGFRNDFAQSKKVSGDTHKDTVGELFLDPNVIRKLPLIVYCHVVVAGTKHL